MSVRAIVKEYSIKQRQSVSIYIQKYSKIIGAGKNSDGDPVIFVVEADESEMITKERRDFYCVPSNKQFKINNNEMLNEVGSVYDTESGMTIHVLEAMEDNEQEETE